MIMTRAWAMPSRWTFSIAPIAALLDRYIQPSDVVIDPFCGQSERATFGNDLANGGRSAVEWLDDLVVAEVLGDVVLLDPPYSPRQVSECYKSLGMPVSAKDTQNAVLYAQCVSRLTALLRPGGLAIRFGWNSAGFGKSAFDMVEILLVAHGGAHNDTIVTVERKR